MSSGLRHSARMTMSNQAPYCVLSATQAMLARMLRRWRVHTPSFYLNTRMRRGASRASLLWPRRDATDFSVLRQIDPPFDGPVVEFDPIEIVLVRSDAGE
jgi:hypothetical protein